MIKNIILDWGGVMLTLDKERCLEAFDKVAGVPNFGEYLNPYLQKGFFAMYENGDIDDAQFCEAIREISTNKSVGYKEVEQALEAFLIDIPKYKTDLFLKLKERYTLYVLSNNNPICWRISQRKFIESGGVDAYDVFEKIFLSFEMNLSKPGKEIFLKMVQEAGFKPEECLFVDDAIANVETAAELGFQTLFYDVNTNLADAIFEKLGERW